MLTAGTAAVAEEQTVGERIAAIAGEQTVVAAGEQTAGKDFTSSLYLHLLPGAMLWAWEDLANILE